MTVLDRPRLPASHRPQGSTGAAGLSGSFVGEVDVGQEDAAQHCWCGQHAPHIDPGAPNRPHPQAHRTGSFVNGLIVDPVQAMPPFVAGDSLPLRRGGRRDGAA